MHSYKCYFLFNNSPKSQRDLYVRNVVHGHDGPRAFIDGFWITSETVHSNTSVQKLKFTKGCDGKYWIPPSQILYIEKIGKEAD